MFIRFPMCSAERPALLLRDFVESWTSFRDSAEAKAAREVSQPKPAGTLRPSKQIRNLQLRKERGRLVKSWIDKDWYSWHRLSPEDKEIYQEHISGVIHAQIADLRFRQRQQPKYLGNNETWLATRSSAARPDCQR